MPCALQRFSDIVEGLLQLRIDPGAHSELALLGDGIVAIEPNALFTIGHSMGSTIGVGWASVDPRLRGAVWSGAGGMVTENRADRDGAARTRTGARSVDANRPE